MFSLISSDSACFIHQSRFSKTLVSIFWKNKKFKLEDQFSFKLFTFTSSDQRKEFWQKKKNKPQKPQLFGMSKMEAITFDITIPLWIIKVGNNLRNESYAYDGYQNFSNFLCKFMWVRIVTFVSSQSNEVLPVSDQSERSISPIKRKKVA